MRIYISGNELGRRLALAPLTLRNRLRQNHIEPDAVAITGNKTGLLFEADKLPSLRQTLTPVETNAQ